MKGGGRAANEFTRNFRPGGAVMLFNFSWVIKTLLAL
jgi:hypothetical protein